jgi:hypothetical protein
VGPDHHARVDDHLAVQRQALNPGFYIVDDNELLQGRREPAEDAADRPRLTLGAAAVQARADDPLRPLAGFQAAQLSMTLQPIGAHVTSQLAAALQPIGAHVTSQLAAALQPIGAHVTSQLAAALQPLAGFQAAQLVAALRPLADVRAELAREVRAMTAGPWPGYANQITLASGAGLTQLAAYTSAAPAFTTRAQVADATGDPDVVPRPDDDADHAHKIDAAAFAMVLVWVCALGMPAAQVLLSSEAQQVINSYVGMIALALIVTWRINDNRRP